MGIVKNLVTLLALAALAAPALSAQFPEPPPGTPELPDPSATKESFVIQPKSLLSGAKNITIRLVSNTPAGFVSSSSKPPLLSFSAGATLVVGSFRMLNSVEAEARVDVDADAFGAVEVALKLFSVNGSKVLSTLRGTLAITGPSEVSGSSASLSVESIELVQVNVSSEQKAGNIVISGSVNGEVRLTAPTGTNFSSQPKVDGGGSTIERERLEESNTVFAFSIGNPALTEVKVRITEIAYGTQYFGLAGGMEGALACEITGPALGGQSALVVNAHTALTTIEGENDIPDPVDETGSENESDSEDTPPTTAGTSLPVRGTSRSITSKGKSPRRADNSGLNNRARGVPGYYGSSARRPVSPRYQSNQKQRTRNFPRYRKKISKRRDSSLRGAGKPGADLLGDGRVEFVKGDEGDSGRKGVLDVVGADDPRARLQVNTGLRFCNKDFTPIDVMVLNRIVAQEASVRVWVSLTLEKNRNPYKIDTVMVTLKLHGTTRRIQLTETGKDTGEFRCTKEGVLVVSENNPDSNREEKTTPRKARINRYR